ncbi:uncharacterized protein [Dermacentor albipictus]|uniref:uncharacterized protein isoform X2 n=1 Tax=Dermacentor albipictus TaxID=60249 RepID=UPI0038FC1195
MMLESLRLLVVAAALPMALRASHSDPQGAGCTECLLKEFRLEKHVDVQRLTQLSRDQIAEVFMSNLLCDRCWSVSKQDRSRIFGCMGWVSRLYNTCDNMNSDDVATTRYRFVRVLIHYFPQAWAFRPVGRTFLHNSPP